MPLIDRITDVMSRITPSKSSKPPNSMSGGIGHGMVPFNDDMIVSKPAIVFHTSQIFFNFLAMACFASVASFQAKWGVGPSGLSGFAIFISVAGIFLSAFMLLVPVIYEKYDKFMRLARALKEVRVGFILTGVGTTASLLIAFIVTISAWTQPGCKDPDNDPSAKEKGDDFKKGLDGWCSTKKAAGIFFWLAFGFWLASLILLILDWRSGKLYAPRDPAFTVPEPTHDVEEGDDDEDTAYTPITQTQASTAPQIRYDNSNLPNSPFSDSNRFTVPSSSSYTPATTAPSLPASRPSIDAYGAFSDPAPSGFVPAPAGYNTPPASNFGTAPPSSSRPAADAYGPFSDQPPTEMNAGPKMSRTMQYADPYAAVRASLGTPGSSPQSVPPSYESYQGYR